MIIEVDTPEAMWAKHFARKALELAETELADAENRLEIARERLKFGEDAVIAAAERVEGAKRLLALAANA